MAEKKLGAVLLSGLMIGPILGSGIVLLPPLVYDTVGDWAILSWTVMMVISVFFAFLFGQLSIRFPGDAGIANAVEFAFGTYIKRLAAMFLIGAACFGPVAVMMVAAQYLHPSRTIPPELIGFILLLIGSLLLLNTITSVGTIAFILSTLVVVILFVGSVYSLTTYPKASLFETPFSILDFGYSLLLLFWALVGWEIIGNYSAEVHNPNTTIPQAVFYSVITIMIVSVTVAAGIQWTDSASFHGEHVTITTLIFPLFGRLSTPIMGGITASLCMTTYLLVIGGVSRLIASQAEERFFPSLLKKRTQNNVPIVSVLALTGVHTLIYAALACHWLTLERVVAIANGFFLANAICGIFAAIRIFSFRFVKITAAILASVFIAILCFSSPVVLMIIGGLTGYCVYKQYMTQHRTVFQN